MFAGVVGAPSDAGFPDPPYTTLETTPVSREKPYLFVDARGHYQVRVPSARTNTSGTTWAAGITAGRTIPLRDFFVATPSDSAKAIDRALSRGKHLLLTPGVYDVGAQPLGQAGRHGRPRHRARDAHRRPRRRPAHGRPTCPASSSPASRSTPAP